MMWRSVGAGFVLKLYIDLNSYHRICTNDGLFVPGNANILISWPHWLQISPPFRCHPGSQNRTLL